MNQSKDRIITSKTSEFLEAFPEIQIPKTIEQAFQGMFSFRGNPTPNITNVVEAIDKIKTQILESNRNGVILDGKTYFPTNKSTESLLANISLCFITSQDSGTEIKVSNIFNEGKEETISIIEKFPEGDTYFQTISIGNLLGYYYPLTGSIIIFIDRILLSHKEPERKLQEVILHEFIHAMLDISPRGIENNEGFRLCNRHLTISDEEVPVNDLTEYVYKNVVTSETNNLTPSQLIKIEGILRAKLINLEKENYDDYKKLVMPYTPEYRSRIIVPTTPEEKIDAINYAKNQNDEALELYEDSNFLKDTYQVSVAEHLRGTGWKVHEMNHPGNHGFGLYATKKVGNLNLVQRIYLNMAQTSATLTYCLIVNENLCLYYDSTDFSVVAEHCKDDSLARLANPKIHCKLKNKKDRTYLCDEFYTLLKNECFGLVFNTLGDELVENLFVKKLKGVIDEEA